MSKYRLLFIIVSIFLLTRLAVLLFFIDNVFECEELHQGVVAKEIMEGPALPLFEYPPNAYAGGPFLVGILTIPFFALLGKNLFALKLTPLLFSTATLIVLFLFAYKFFNRRVAIITGLLYIFSSFIWIGLNLANEGFHSENLFFTVVAMYLFYEIIFNHKNKSIYYFSLGLISGLGTYWTYTFLVTLLTLLFIWFLQDKKLLLKKGIYIFLVGFLSGMIPWFYYNLQSQFKGVTDIFPGFFEQNPFTLNNSLDIAQRFLRLINFSRMLIFIGPDYFPFNLSGKLYYLIYGLSFLYILRSYKYSLRKITFSKEALILIFPALLLIIATFYAVEPGGSGNFMDWKYLVSLFLFVFLTIAISLDRLFLKVRILKLASISILSIFIIIGAIRFLIKINFKDFGNGFNRPGYSYTFLAESFNCKYPRNFYKILDNMLKLPAPQKYEVLTQTLNIHISENIQPVDFKEYLKLSYRLDEKYRPFFYKILIKGLYYTSNLPLKDLIHEVNLLSEQVDDKYKPYLYEGIGTLVVKRNPFDTVKYKEGAYLLDEKYIPYYYRGLSEPVYLEYIGDYVNRCKGCLGWLKEQYQPFYLEGIGEVLAKMGFSYIVERTLDDKDTKIFYDFLEKLESEYKRYVLEGMGKGLSYFYSYNNEKEIYQFINTFKGNDKKMILKEMVANLR